MVIKFRETDENKSYFSKLDETVKQEEAKQVNPTTEVSSDCISSPKAEDGSVNEKPKNALEQKSSSDDSLKTIQERSRLFEQAILMLKYEQLKQYSENLSNFENNKRFKNIARLVMQQNENPAQILNDIFREKIGFDLLLNATSAQLSCLVPMVRVFKQYSKNNGKNVLNLELPLIQQYEIEDMNTIFKDKNSRGGGVGLTSITMENIASAGGLTPATSEIYNLSLNLTFADFSEMSKIRYVYQPSKEEAEKGFNEPIEVRYSDLFYQRTQDSANEDNLENFRIKMVIGWYVPRNRPDFITEQFAREIENMYHEFYVTLNRHEVSFDERGVINLKIKYVTYISAASNRSHEQNLLLSSDDISLSQFKQRKEELEKIRKEIAKKNSKSTSEKELKQNLDELKKVEEELKNLSKSSLEEKYRRFINNIYNNNKLYYTFLDQSEYTSFESIVNSFVLNKNSFAQDKEELDQLVQASNKVKASDVSVYSIDDTQKANTLNKIPQFDQKTKNPVGLGEQLIQNSKNINQILIKNIQTENKKIIPFFYLGDLIDSVYQDGVFGSDGFENKNLKLMFGPMFFYDFGDLTSGGVVYVQQGVKNTKDSKKDVIFSSKGKVINIADIPISLNLYHKWFIDEFIDRGVTTLSFRQFLESLLKNLVINAISSNVYPWAPPQPNKIMAKTFSFVKNNQRWKNDSNNTDYTREHFLQNNNNLYVKNKLNSAEELEHLFYITCLDDAAAGFNSNYEDDIKIGIRHLYYNNENGFVKKISFTRSNNALLETSNIIASQSNFTRNLLTGIYNAKVSMFGNSFFRVGERVYIEPTIGAMGIKNTSVKMKNETTENVKYSSTIESAKDLGIGGYYIVTKVSSKIGIGEFDTEVDMIWEKRGDDKGNVKYQVKIAELVENSK